MCHSLYCIKSKYKFVKFLRFECGLLKSCKSQLYIMFINQGIELAQLYYVYLSRYRTGPVLLCLLIKVQNWACSMMFINQGTELAQFYYVY